MRKWGGLLRVGAVSGAVRQSVARSATMARNCACQPGIVWIILRVMKWIDQKIRAVGRAAAVASFGLWCVVAGPGVAQQTDAGGQAPELLAAATKPPTIDGVEITVRPPARRSYVPRTRWQHMEGHTLWTHAAMSALKDHGSPLVEMVPGDITYWCPAYETNDDAKRRAFWVGYMSALAKHESTYKPWAVGGGGRWYGLLQILPATARGYQCNVGTGEALKNGAANLSCAVRIMTYTVQRDGVIHGRDRKWRGVSADWGPMRNPRKRVDMANWLKRQNYCKLANDTRPKARP